MGYTLGMFHRPFLSTASNRKNKPMSVWIPLALVLGLLLVVLTGCTGSPPATLGTFADCPDSPNCVSTKAKDEAHGVPPIETSLTKKETQKRILDIIASLPRTHVVTQSEDYLHVEFTSLLFRFVDDVEFFFAEENGKIHFRSASRLGRSDLGVNRKRMEGIRERFATASENPPDESTTS